MDKGLDWDGYVKNVAQFVWWLNERSPWNADSTLLLRWAAQRGMSVKIYKECAGWFIGFPSRGVEQWPDGVTLPNLFVAFGEEDFEAVRLAAAQVRRLPDFAEAEGNDTVEAMFLERRFP